MVKCLSRTSVTRIGPATSTKKTQLCVSNYSSRLQNPSTVTSMPPLISANKGNMSQMKIKRLLRWPAQETSVASQNWKKPLISYWENKSCTTMQTLSWVNQKGAASSPKTPVGRASWVSLRSAANSKSRASYYKCRWKNTWLKSATNLSSWSHYRSERWISWTRSL